MEQEIFLKEKKATRLLVDAHVFDDIYQGTRTFLKGIYTNFDAKENNIEVYLAAHNIVNLKKEFGDRPNIYFVKLNSTNKYYRLAIEIPKLITKLNIDFAHFNYYLPLILNKKCKYIVTIHDVLFLDFPQFFPKGYYYKNKYLFQRSARRAEIVTTVSNYSLIRIKENFGIKNEVHILPNALDKRFSKKYDKEQHRTYIDKKYKVKNFILYVSRLEPRKNHIQLLNSYEELELWKKGIELVFIGKKAIRDESLDVGFQRVKEKSNNKLHFFENIEGDDLIPFYNAASLAVFPSICEGFGIPPLESAALTTPTLCSNLTAMSDFIFFGKNHINPEKKNELKDRINALINRINRNGLNQIELESISKRILEKYKWKNTSETLIKIIKK